MIYASSSGDENPDVPPASSAEDAAIQSIDPILDLDQVVEENPDGIVVYDSKGVFLYLNQEAERLLGRTRAELVGQAVWEFYPESTETDAPFRHAFQRTLSERSLSTYETFNRSVQRWLLVHLMPLSARRPAGSDTDTDRRGVAAYFRDVSERKEAERQRQESEKRFRAVADAAPVLIWTSGEDALCDWFNQPWLDFTGRTMDQELGNGWTEGVHPEDLARCLEVYMGAFTRQESFTLEYRMRRFDSEFRWMLNHGIPRYAVGDGQAFLGFIGSCVDITDKKRAEEQVVRLLLDKTELVQRQSELLAQQRAFLQDILSAVTEGVLRLCDSEAGLPPAPNSLPETVSLTLPSDLRLLRKAVGKAALTAGLPEERTSDLLTAVGEAGMNVVTHASGRGEGRVFADTARGAVQVRVIDSGPGIALDQLHRALLERGWTTAGSLGHGFWLMLRTADRVSLLTEEGKGTTVVLEKMRSHLEPQWLRQGSREAG